MKISVVPFIKELPDSGCMIILEEEKIGILKITKSTFFPQSIAVIFTRFRDSSKNYMLLKTKKYDTDEKLIDWAIRKMNKEIEKYGIHNKNKG